jgi:hypothetical protein
MSTKIYNAFKVKDPSTVWNLIWKVRDLAEANAIQALKNHYLKLVREMDPDKEDYQKERERDQERDEVFFRLGRAREIVRNGYRDNVRRPEREEYSLDVTLAIYPFDGEYYLRTFWEGISVLGEVFDFVAKMPELEDFHYQNQTDPPEEVSSEDWEKRERVWNAIIDAFHGIGNHVAVDVVSWEGFYRIDPWLTVAREWRDNPPVLPSREEVWSEKLNELRSITNVSFSDGRIEINNGASLIFKKDEQWFSLVAGVEQAHPDLNHAGHHVYFEHMPELHKDMVRRLMERHSTTP